MPLYLEYHPRMRYWMPVLAVLLISFFALAASAQANGVPPSVTSFGFGGHPGFNGVLPSVTSPRPRGTGTVHAPQQIPTTAPTAHIPIPMTARWTRPQLILPTTPSSPRAAPPPSTVAGPEAPPP